MSDLAFLDLETTGLDPRRHEIIEAAVVRVDGRSLEELDSVSVRIAPLHIETAEPEALRVNGCDPATWGGGSLEEALLQVEPLLEGAHLAGHNVAAFDRPFVLAAYERLGYLPPLGKYTLDTVSLCWPLYQRGLVESLSLSALCDYYGISNAGAHGALADARRALEVARRVLGMGPPCHCQLEIGDRPCPRHGDTECQACGAVYLASAGHTCPAPPEIAIVRFEKKTTGGGR